MGKIVEEVQEAVVPEEDAVVLRDLMNALDHQVNNIVKVSAE